MQGVELDNPRSPFQPYDAMNASCGKMYTAFIPHSLVYRYLQLLTCLFKELLWAEKHISSQDEVLTRNQRNSILFYFAKDVVLQLDFH